MSDKYTKVLTLNSDGSTNEEPREVEVKDDSGDTVMVFIGKPVPHSEYRRKLKSQKYTKKVPACNGRPGHEKSDSEACIRDFLIEQVTGWRLLVGADDKPLPYSEEIKKYLFTEHFDTGTNVRIASGLTGAEVAEFTEADKSESH